MTHELILTSVVQGLAPHDHGFCPVAADSAIPPRIVQHLSALSHYQHLVEQSPVAYSHLILPGRIEHVLSRVAAAGIDYQNKPNVLAHHVVLEAPEFVSEGPGWLLALPGFHLSEWNTPPVQFSHGRSIPSLTLPPSLTRRQQIARQHRWLDPRTMSLTGFVDTESAIYRAAVQNNDEQIVLAVPPTTPCPRWKELTGDAGWAGVLAETVFTEQPVVLLYNLGTNILPLFVEALALVPHHSSWRTTFCTYYTGLPDTIPCQWKGAVAGTEEAKQLVRDLNNLVIDLTIPMGEAPYGKYVDFARHGQEHMLPLDIEEDAAAANADTKSFDDEEKNMKESNQPPHTSTSPKTVSDASSTQIRMPKKHVGVFDMLLHRTSRFQFYFLYSIMFVLVLILLFLAVDQAGNFGIVESLRSGKQHEPHVQPDDPKPAAPQHENKSELDDVIEPGQIEQDMPIPREDAGKTFGENREKQKEPLSLFLKDFDVPDYLGINFPNVQDNHIDVPASTTFAELSPLYPFGSALELRYIPLFGLPKTTVKTRQMTDKLPNLVWQVESFDEIIPTEGTPMYCFQLTEAGLVMDWQQEGLNNQYLYDTVLFSLGFLELGVADMPESVKEIPMFAPIQVEPMKVSDLAKLADLEKPEYVVELPFASELWQNVLAVLNPPKSILLEVRAEPEGNGMRTDPSAASYFSAYVRTSQQVGKLIERGETVFQTIEINFTAEASLEKIVWKSDKSPDIMDAQKEAKSIKDELERKIKELEAKVFEGDENARKERDSYRDELRLLDLELKNAENLIEKLPAAYEELKRNESTRFHYSVFLSPGDGKRKLLILKTDSKE